MRKTSLAVTVVSVLACGSETERAVQFAEELEIDMAVMTESPSGLAFQDLVLGEGEEAVAGKIVVVHYTGWLADGSMFDSSVNNGRPESFTLGNGEMIDGWDEGIPGMRVGGKRKLVLPPALAYGRRGFPPVIPRNATLVFDVELLDVR